MILSVVPTYAALLALLFLLLSAYVIQGRGRHQAALGTAGSTDLERRIRVHGNFAEYVPFTLLLLAMAELRGAAPAILHGLCLGLLVGRVAHAWGVSRDPENLRFRMVGMVLTFTALAGAALTLLIG